LKKSVLGSCLKLLLLRALSSEQQQANCFDTSLLFMVFTPSLLDRSRLFSSPTYITTKVWFCSATINHRQFVSVNKVRRQSTIFSMIVLLYLRIRQCIPWPKQTIYLFNGFRIYHKPCPQYRPELKQVETDTLYYY